MKKEDVLIKENKLERDSYEGDTHGPAWVQFPVYFHWQSHAGRDTHTHTHTHQLLACPPYRHADMLTHINRKHTLGRLSQTSLLTGCDYIQERGNVLRLRWEVVDGGDMSALALNFTQDCLPISPCPFFTLRGEFAVGCWKCGAMAR